ncbi:hypothetical protein ILYODFUR_019785 [Ilyodon furcidens]|uniref:Secreted protein n=1 Tax=Ilyodon furcidens TaxID=33524 RepID=A0ABV0TLJ2_9TELE
MSFPMGSQSCTSGANMFSSRICMFSISLLLSFIVTTVRYCFLLGVGVEETFLCSPSRAVSSRYRDLPVSRLPSSEGIYPLALRRDFSREDSWTISSHLNKHSVS